MVPRPPLPSLALAASLLLPCAAAQGDPHDLLQEGVGRVEMTVDDAIAIALGSNLEIEAADLDAEIRRYDQLGSWGAFDWVVDGRFAWTDATREGSGFLSGGAETTTETGALSVDLARPMTTGGSFRAHFDTLDRKTDSILFNEPRQRESTLSLSYVQPLRRGAWSEYATSRQREAELTFRRQLEVTRATRQAIAVRASDAYWDLVAAIEQLGVAESAITLGQNRLEQNQRELDAGVGTEVEVLQARAELATREEGLLQARNDVAQRMDALKSLLMARDPAWDVEIVPVTPLPSDLAAEVPTWTSALTVASELRSELRQAGLDIDAARVRSARAASERLSGVDLELTASSSSVDSHRSTTLQKTGEYRFPTYTAALVYNMPIGNRTAAYADRAAQAGVRAAILAYDQQMLSVTTEVRDAVRNVGYAAQQVRATSTSLELARRQLAAEEARFDNDLSTTFQVLEFQQQLIEAMSNERTARVNYAKALTRLESVQGLIGEE